MKKYVILFIIIAINLMFFQSTSYGFALNISPPSFKASVEPGGSTSGTVTVQNKSDEAMGVKVYVEDWVYGPDGGKTFQAAGTTPLSCAKWIRVFPKTFQLEAGEKMGVQYTVNMPEDAEGGYYAVIFFESIPGGAPEGEEGMVVRFAGRLGTIVYLETKGKSVRKGSIESLSITPPTSSKPLEMALAFKNAGNVYIGAEGTLTIIDEEGNVLGKKRINSLNTLPGDTRQTKAEWFGELEEGAYYGVVTLDIGSDEPVVGEAEIIVSSGGFIKTFSVDTSSEKPLFSVVVENAGDLNIDTSGRIDIYKEKGEVIQTIGLKRSLIAPGKEKELEGVPEKDLPPGAYTAKAVISIGNEELTKEEAFSVE